MKNIKIFAAAIAMFGMAACCNNQTQTMAGFIADAGMNTVTVENFEGTYHFLTEDADKSEANGMLLGSPVLVEYKGDLKDDSGVAIKVSTDLTYADAIGKWTIADPINPEGVMGVEIFVQGEASSINMQTLNFTGWELQGEEGKIILKGISEGSGEPTQFANIAIIEKNDEGVTTLTLKGTGIVYTKAE